MPAGNSEDRSSKRCPICTKGVPIAFIAVTVVKALMLLRHN